MPPRVRIDTSWSDLVFHVLAHVDLNQAAPSLFAGRYVAWVGSQPARAGERTLEQDAAALARVLAAPEAAIGVQLLAVLFANAEQARAVAERELAELTAADVAAPAALRELEPVLLPAAELLRCAALLEAPWHADLPEARTDRSELAVQLARVATCAPRLAGADVVSCRALTRHGRVFGERLYVGLPDPALGVSVEQVALQAGHEASVLEVSSEARARGLHLGERAVEAVALVLFAQRCARAGLAQEHAAWGREWGVRSEHGLLAALPEPGRTLATELLRG